MALLSVTTVGRGGVDVTTPANAADAGGSDKFANTGAQFVLIKNGSGGSYTATLTIQSQPDGQAVTSKTVAISAGHYAIIGPFPPPLYNDAQGNMNIGHSATTSITLQPFALGN